MIIFSVSVRAKVQHLIVLTKCLNLQTWINAVVSDRHIRKITYHKGVYDKSTM